MTTVRIVAVGVMLWAAMAASLRAETLTVTSTDGTWTYYVSGANSSALSNLLGGNTFGGRAPAPRLAPSNASSAIVGDVDPPVAPTISSQPILGVGNAPNSGAPVLSAPVLGGSDSSSSGATANAFINFGSSNYADASSLLTGAPTAWYNSPTVQAAFGGHTPTVEQQAEFTSAVLNDVRHTFQLAGLNPTITTDPSVSASHMISVVSGAWYGPNSNAIGITNVGDSGFGFIDKLSYATSVDQLAWAVAHNVSHELMHAFGVSSHPDTSGDYVDAAVATWSVLTSPDSTFSPEAASLMNQSGFGDLSQNGGMGSQGIDGAQEILSPVPEPATYLGWSLALAGMAFRRWRSGPRETA
jgi:hypothetical protein